jgi:Putative Actinobacterial Holin-X, holin superfamily III
MADQAKMTLTNGAAGDGRQYSGEVSSTGRAGSPAASEPAASGVVTGIANLGENLLNLAELQARLAAIEVRQTIQATQVYAAIVVGSSLLAVGSLVVALIGLAELCVTTLGISRAAAFLGVGALALGLASAAAAVAIVQLRQRAFHFPLSAEEFGRNMHWIRTVVRQGARSSSRR